MKPIISGRSYPRHWRSWPALAWICCGSVMAADWQGTLPDGSRIQVDPTTRRAWHQEGDRMAPLWDGVHRLDDGSVVIVRDGAAVPNERMLETWRLSDEQSQLDAAPCDELVKRVCGADERCAKSEPCGLAHQLRDMVADERSKSTDVRARSITGNQCREAMGNQFFVPCE